MHWKLMKNNIPLILKREIIQTETQGKMRKQERARAREENAFIYYSQRDMDCGLKKKKIRLRT